MQLIAGDVRAAVVEGRFPDDVDGVLPVGLRPQGGRPGTAGGVVALRTVDQEPSPGVAPFTARMR